MYKNNIINKKTLETFLNVNNTEQEQLVKSIYLILKICFSLLAVVSLIKLGFTSKVRLSRLKEINDSFLYEKARNKALISRYDDLLSFEGEQRFMKDQDQMISRDIIRVIWR